MIVFDSKTHSVETVSGVSQEWNVEVVTCKKNRDRKAKTKNSKTSHEKQSEEVKEELKTTVHYQQTNRKIQQPKRQT